MTSLNSFTESRKSLKNDASVIVFQSNAGSFFIQYLKWSVEMGKGLAPARKAKSAPAPSPYQARPLPRWLGLVTGPSQILLTAEASAAVRQLAGSLGPPVHTNAFAS